MQIGVPKETTSGERRVALVPDVVAKLLKAHVDATDYVNQHPDEAQTTADKGATFNLCVAAEPVLKDVEVSVAFKAVKGENDQGGGVVWRYQDANNYYVARMNPLEDNFRVYKVVGGKRSPEFQNAEVKIPSGEWHTLKVRMVGDHIECFLDDKKYLDVKDGTFTGVGKVGLWTKADAQTSFDNFQVKSLGK